MRAPTSPPSNKGRRFPVEILSPDEVRAMIKLCSTRAPTGIKNRALIAVLWRSGLRLGEALALRPKDINPEAGSVAVLHGKGARSRVVGLDETASVVVARWMDRRRNLGINGNHLLFCTLKGQVLQARYVRHLLVRLAAKAGIEKRVHPHGLRHAHAVELAAEGTPMNLVQAQLGHASLATTNQYLQHIAPQQLIEAVKKRQWNLESNTQKTGPNR